MARRGWARHTRRFSHRVRLPCRTVLVPNLQIGTDAIMRLRPGCRASAVALWPVAAAGRLVLGGSARHDNGSSDSGVLRYRRRSAPSHTPIASPGRGTTHYSYILTTGHQPREHALTELTQTARTLLVWSSWRVAVRAAGGGARHPQAAARILPAPRMLQPPATAGFGVGGGAPAGQADHMPRLPRRVLPALPSAGLAQGAAGHTRGSGRACAPARLGL